MVVALAAGLLSAGEAGARVCADDVALASTRVRADYVSQGRTVRALLWRPQRPNGAAVVLLHGARGLHNDAAFLDAPAHQLASRGWYVLAPAYYDAARPSPVRRESEVQSWMLAARDGAALLARLPAVEPQRVATWGYSLGGYVAVESAMAFEPAAAAVSLAAGTDVFPSGRGRRGIPVLLMHARRDPVISPVSTREWAGSLRVRSADVRTVALDRDGHGYDVAGWCDVFARTRAFLEETLAPASAR